jgi:hypothetical protein
MKMLGFFRDLTLVAYIILLIVPCVSAQTMLHPNQTLENQFIFHREDPYSVYEPKLYQASLDAGHWTVVVDILDVYESLEVNVTVASDIHTIDVIAVSGSGWGNYPEVDFHIESDDTLVYILVHENSVNGDTEGLFDIGVYDDEHLPASTTTTTSADPQSTFLMIGIPIVFVVAVLAIAGVYFSSKRNPPRSRTQVVQAPQRAIPQRYQHRTEVDDGLRTVRLPVQCPECGAPLTSEAIDWVGPLEAKCNYCGATVRAKFERI